MKTKTISRVTALLNLYGACRSLAIDNAIHGEFDMILNLDEYMCEFQQLSLTRLAEEYRCYVHHVVSIVG